VVVGWKLDSGQRAALLAQFAPKYARAIADHVTLAVNVPSSTPLPHAVNARIIGCADDGQGVQAMVVEIDGSTARPDGGTYHITWSLAEGRKPKDSNDVIRGRGFGLLPESVEVKLEPASFG
jgi:hypothetical protein